MRFFTRRQVASVLLLASSIFLLNCGRKIHYTFQQIGKEDRLVPPKVKSKSDVEGTIIRFRSRQHTRTAPCTFSNVLVDLQWRGATAEIRLKDDLATEKKIESQDSRLSEPVSLDLLQQFHNFQTALDLLEEQRCFSSGEASRLARQVIESLPMPSQTAYGLLYGSFAQLGYIDLMVNLHLRVVAPTLRPGISDVQKSADLLGSKTEHYGVQPSPSGRAVQLQYEKTEFDFDGKKSVNKSAQRLLNFPPSPAYYRLLFLTRGTEANYNSAVLAARNWQLLEEKTKLIQQHPEQCTTRAFDFYCILIPAKTAAIPEMRVMTNQQPILIYPGGTVRGAIQKAGEPHPERVLPRLKILRAYRGKKIPVEFDRSKTDILRLVLTGGEELQW